MSQQSQGKLTLTPSSSEEEDRGYRERAEDQWCEVIVMFSLQGVEEWCVVELEPDPIGHAMARSAAIGLVHTAHLDRYLAHRRPWSVVSIQHIGDLGVLDIGDLGALSPQ